MKQRILWAVTRVEISRGLVVHAPAESGGVA